MVVIELEHAVGKRAGSRSDLAIAFEEEALRIRSGRDDLETKRHLRCARDDDGIPEAVDSGRRSNRRRETRGRDGDEQRGEYQQSLHGEPSPSDEADTSMGFRQ